MTQREAIKMLKEAGFTLDYTGRHIYFIKNGVKFPLPNHKGDLKPHEAAHVKSAIKKANEIG